MSAEQTFSEWIMHRMSSIDGEGCPCQSLPAFLHLLSGFLQSRKQDGGEPAGSPAKVDPASSSRGTQPYQHPLAGASKTCDCPFREQHHFQRTGGIPGRHAAACKPGSFCRQLSTRQQQF